MKLEPALEKVIKVKMDPRKPVFFTRVKMFFLMNQVDWVENCRGILILYHFEKGSFFTIMNIISYQINFDMEIYTNFLNYARFVGDCHAMHFWLPTESKTLRAMIVVESKEELMLLKKSLEKQLRQFEVEEELSFFRQPEVKELLQKADIQEDLLQFNLRFRNEVETEVKQFLKSLEDIQRKKSKNGFKAYGLGREQWKLDEDEKNFLKEKKKDEVISLLIRLRKQAKLS